MLRVHEAADVIAKGQGGERTREQVLEEKPGGESAVWVFKCHGGWGQRGDRGYHVEEVGTCEESGREYLGALDGLTIGWQNEVLLLIMASISTSGNKSPSWSVTGND